MDHCPRKARYGSEWREPGVQQLTMDLSCGESQTA
jgi:hypothetical protein